MGTIVVRTILSLQLSSCNCSLKKFVFNVSEWSRKREHAVAEITKGLRATTLFARMHEMHDPRRPAYVMEKLVTDHVVLLQPYCHRNLLLLHYKNIWERVQIHFFKVPPAALLFYVGYTYLHQL